MSTVSIIAQGIGIVAMVVAILSFQQKTQKCIMLFQFVSNCLFTLHFFLLGAMMGSLLNLIGVVRAAVFAQRNKKWAGSVAWIYGFVGACLLVYGMNFALLGTKPTWQNLLLEFLPVIGMAATTISFRMEKAGQVRAFSLISSPMWLIYNIFHASVGGTLTETFALISILVGIVRLDIRKKTANT